MVLNVDKKIVVTGGGSGGHTIPALVMIKYWRKLGHQEIYYIGSVNGVEKKVVSEFVTQYFSISTGKLRRYFSIENFLDFFKFFKGIIQAFLLLLKLRPSVVFSTGGFVALPVVIAAKILGLRVVIHEQTTHVGLANKLSSYFAHAICISFESSAKYFPKEKTHFTGYPLRAEFYLPVNILQSFCGKDFLPEKKILLILGGGNGSLLLNNFVKSNMQVLCQEFNVILQTGTSYEQDFLGIAERSFWSFSFLQHEMLQLLSSADYIIARAGAGTVCELIQLKKKCLFVPLAIAQKNEQWFNAQTAAELIGSKVVTEDEWRTLSIDQVLQQLKSIKEIKVSEKVLLEKKPAQTIDEITFYERL